MNNNQRETEVGTLKIYWKIKGFSKVARYPSG